MNSDSNLSSVQAVKWIVNGINSVINSLTSSKTGAEKWLMKNEENKDWR